MAGLFKDVCNHNRAHQIYAESILSEKGFWAVECESYDDFSEGYCLSNEKIRIGEKCKSRQG